MIQETFLLLPYWFDKEYAIKQGNEQVIKTEVKRFALIRDTHPFYIRVCSTPDAEYRKLSPIGAFATSDCAYHDRFFSQYRQAQVNDDISTMQELAPKIAIGFAAYLLSKAIWNNKHNRWDNLSAKDVERYIQEYDNARDKRDTIDEHRDNEPEYWKQTQELWESSKIESFDKASADLWCAVCSGVKQYLGLENTEASRLLNFFQSKDNCETFIADVNKCSTYNDLAKVINDLKTRNIIKIKKVLIDYLYENSEIPSITNLKKGKDIDSFYNEVKRVRY